VEYPFEHYERMAELAKASKGAMLVSINDHPEIRRVFDGLYFESLGLNYTVSGGKGVEAKELLIWNEQCETRRSRTRQPLLF